MQNKNHKHTKYKCMYLSGNTCLRGIDHFIHGAYILALMITIRF